MHILCNMFRCEMNWKVKFLPASPVCLCVSISLKERHPAQLGHTDKTTLNTNAAPSEQYVTGSGPHFHALILGHQKRFSFALDSEWKAPESSSIWNRQQNYTTVHFVHLNNRRITKKKHSADLPKRPNVRSKIPMKRRTTVHSIFFIQILSINKYSKICINI